ncbi:MAG TPA: ABC transporter permease [Longimicrobiales bacterium]|nr:ABC transporter permease [Longimicrobiales bacterium]
MYIREGAVLALQQIRAQKLKSFFAVLGVIIGVMFLITVVSVVEGLNKYMEEDFARQVWGLNTLMVRRFPSVNMESDPEVWREMMRRPRITFDDADYIKRNLSVPALIAEESEGGGKLQGPDGAEVDNVWFKGVSVDFFKIHDYEIERGRVFTAPEDRMSAPVVVLGAEAADKLFGALDPIGRSVKIEGIPFQIIGILKKQGTLFGMSLDNQAIAPAHSAISRFVAPHSKVDQVVVKPLDPADFEKARIELEAIMRVRHRLHPAAGNDFAIDTAEDSLGFWNTIKNILLVAFPGLVSIALVVGGIVIMNIMLVSVTERTREIGIRKALGARRKDIVTQVMVESATLSLVGALIGISIGIGGAKLVEALSPLPAAISPFWILMAATMGVTVGVVAGIYPANRAAKFDPVVALRYE